MGRKLCLLLIARFLNDSALFQTALAVTVLFVAFVLQRQLAPFVSSREQAEARMKSSLGRVAAAADTAAAALWRARKAPASGESQLLLRAPPPARDHRTPAAPLRARVRATVAGLAHVSAATVEHITDFNGTLLRVAPAARSADTARCVAVG
jgi:hypothetical protein